MPSYLTRNGRRRYLDPNATSVLKAQTPGSRTLILTTNLSDDQIIVASGRPGRGNITKKNYDRLPGVSAPTAPGLVTDPSTIAWEAGNGIVLTGSADVTLTGRNIRSLDPAVPAIYLNNFTGKLTIVNCNLYGYTQPGTGKAIIGSSFNCGARVYVSNTAFFSGNPMAAGKSPGHAFKLSGFKEFRVTNCDFYGTAGIYLAGWLGTVGQAGDTVTLTNNRFYNIDGRVSNPSNSDGWGHGNIPGTDIYPVQMIQMNACIGVPRVLIQDNRVINEPNKSRAEDIVSTYLSSGTSTSPIIINRNLFEGQYIYDYAFDPLTSVAFGSNMPTSTPGWIDYRGFQSSGGGGLAGDGAGATYLQDSCYIQYTNNTVIGMSNYGLGFAAGHDFLMNGNTILRSGYVRGLPRNIRVSWKHVPIQIQDYNTGGGSLVDDGTGTNTKRVRWYNNDVTNNTYGYVAIHPTTGAISNEPMLVNSPLRTNTNNTAIPNVTIAQEDAAIASHLSTWSGLGLTIGRIS